MLWDGRVKGSKIMKKLLLALVLVAALAALTVAVASADPPPGVGPAEVWHDWMTCGATTLNGSSYVGVFEELRSNGSTDHRTYKCKMELVDGPGDYWYVGYPSSYCYSTVSFEGQKAMWTIQCFGPAP